MPDFAADKVVQFFGKHQTAVVAGAAGAGGVFLGAKRAHANGNEDPALASAVGTGLVAGAGGAVLYGGRRMIWPTAKNAGIAAYDATSAAVKSVPSAWKAATHIPGPVKAMGLLAGVVGLGVGARAFAHEEAPNEDHLVNDGMGGYEAVTGVRERARSMNASGDLVFGLNARRH